MLSYYTSIIIMSWMALIVLCILVRENARIKRSDKWLFYLTYILIGASAFAEWAGLHLDGIKNFPVWILMLVKCADYILTPIAGGAFVGPMRMRGRTNVLLTGVLAGNTLFQIVSLFFGWMTRIDDNNNYTHGPLYGVYIAVYLIVIALIVMEFISYGKRFSRQNRQSLYAILALVIAGVCIQEFAENGCRTAYLAMTMGAALMYIHYTEFSQLATDEYVKKQKRQLVTDAMTGVYNRYAYSKMLKKYYSIELLPQELAVFVIDINSLKEINDKYGHEAGDELICGAASCMKDVLGERGRIYRIGGDEFIILAEMNRNNAEVLIEDLKNATSQWRGRRVKLLRLAIGLAISSEHRNLSLERLVKEADKRMYIDKSNYYQQTGYDRRKV